MRDVMATLDAARDKAHPDTTLIIYFSEHSVLTQMDGGRRREELEALKWDEVNFDWKPKAPRCTSR